MKYGCFTAFTLALWWTTGLSAGNLKDFSAEYLASKDGDVVANSTIVLKRRDDGSWSYESRYQPTTWLAKLTGVTVTETSRFRLTNGNIRVTDYRYKRTGVSKDVHLTFDWNGMSVTNDIDGDHWNMSIEENTVDKLSILLAVVLELQKGTEKPLFTIADGGRLKPYEFINQGKEIIDTALGKIRTIRVLRRKPGRKTPHSVIWFAPALNYIPVKIERTNKEKKAIVITISTLK